MELLLLGAAIFAVGLLFGYRMGHTQPAPAAPSPSEAEARSLQEDRAAFQQLLGYNADCAYGSEK